jgi:protein-tyrosine phosphatase
LKLGAFENQNLITEGVVVPSILFVCTANQIRSPLAENIFRKLLFDKGLFDQWRVESAGTWAVPGLPAQTKAIQVGQEISIDLSQHRSKGVDEALIDSFDIVLAMEDRHVEALRFEFPAKQRRIFLLSEMTGKNLNVPDPIFGNLDQFRFVANLIDELLVSGFDRILTITDGTKEIPL